MPECGGRSAGAWDHAADARRGIERSDRPGRHRWVVERSHAWFNRARRLPVRYERRADIYEAFTFLQASLITLRQIQRFC